MKTKKVELITKPSPTKKNSGPGPGAFSGEFYQTSKKECTYLSQTSPNIEEEGTFPIHSMRPAVP